MTNVLPLALYLSQLAFAGIVLWYVVGFLGIPEMPKVIAQCLLVLILVFAALSTVLAGPPPASLSQRLPLINAPASIMK